MSGKGDRDAKENWRKDQGRTLFGGDPVAKT